MNSRNTENLLNSSGGILSVLRIALPLVLSASCHAVNMFVDRLMLARYSQTACAACMTGGLTNFMVICIFTGTIGYTGTFVAQYVGANRPDRVGCAVWQGIHIALIGSLFMALVGPFSGRIFQFFGHDPAVVVQEARYFEVFCRGAWAVLLPTALSCFWSGRGRTGMILIVSILGTAMNIPFNYALIYGHWGMPELGTAGAAWGSVLASLVFLLIYGIAFFLPSNRRIYHTGSHIFDWDLFVRMVRYGLPNGIQVFLDISAFTIFVVLLGRYGVTVQESTSIAFGINNVSFCPILGIGQTVSILVGQAVGARNISLARKSVASGRNLMIIYMTLCGILFCVFPDLLIGPFLRPGDPGQAETVRISSLMLKLIALYLIFDGANIIYTSAVKGAGDTRYVMILTVVMGWVFFAIPCLIFHICGCSYWYLWGTLDVYVALFAACSFLRYLSGKWTRMQVIESGRIS